MASLDERVSRLEGGYDHLATKADLANQKVDIIKWTFGIVFGAAALATSAALLFQRIFG